ncbi:MAG: ATP-binding protein [candidate division Zixibacteria bacterium]|nr:ATP-binding protein [candidate division Zixibacteria bacterium]
MAVLDLPGNELSGKGSTWPISANSGRGPWAGANLLVVGPAGSGKLSLVRAVLQALDHRIRLSLLDFETEPRIQRVLLDQLRAARPAEPPGAISSGVDALILRHIHRLPPRRMTELINVCRTIALTNGHPPILFHATSHRYSEYSQTLKNELSSFFNCLIQLSGFPRTENRIRQFVADVLADLNHRYGQHILGVDPPVVNLVQQIAERANLYELRNVIERAYFREESSRLSMESITAACAPKRGRGSQRGARNSRRRTLVH